MPRKPIDFSKTYFYKIVCKDTNITECYVGHTTDFTKRKHRHKYCCSTPLDKNHYVNVYDFIRQNGGWSNWEMILIECESCENSLEARKREREYKELISATLNTQIPLRTQNEYYIDNREKKLEQSKNRRVHKREEIREKQNVMILCECGKSVSKSNLARHRKTDDKHQTDINSLQD